MKVKQKKKSNKSMKDKLNNKLRLNKSSKHKTNNNKVKILPLVKKF